jgi:RES domain-containing protein
LRYVKGPPPKGWRFNDLTTEILYAAEVEALATLEVAVRPGWESIQKVLIATMEIPDGSLANFSDLKIRLPSNWNSRPATDDSRLIAREFLNTIASSPASSPPIGLRVPSVLSTTDFNVLLDPSRISEMSASVSSRIPFNTLRVTGS